MKLHASGEDYLETILVLHKKMGMVRSVDVARHMECQNPAQAARWTPCGRAASSLWMRFFLRLIDISQEIVERFYEKHRFFINLLTEAGEDPEVAERAACGMSMLSAKSLLSACGMRTTHRKNDLPA